MDCASCPALRWIYQRVFRPSNAKMKSRKPNKHHRENNIYAKIKRNKGIGFRSNMISRCSRCTAADLRSAVRSEKGKGASGGRRGWEWRIEIGMGLRLPLPFRVPHFCFCPWASLRMSLAHTGKYGPAYDGVKCPAEREGTLDLLSQMTCRSIYLLPYNSPTTVLLVICPC